MNMRFTPWFLALPFLTSPACRDNREAIEEPIVVAAVVVTPSGPTLTTIGRTLQLTAMARDSRGNPLSGRTFTWTSSDTTTVYVAVTGQVTALAAGAATITAATGGVTGSTTVTVSPVVAFIAVSPRGATLRTLGATLQFAVEASDSGHSSLSSVTAVWASRDSTVIRLSASGLATATGWGVTTVTASTDRLTDSVFIAVRALPVILHYDGTTWRTALEDTGTAVVRLASVWGASASAVFAVGAGFMGGAALVRYDGSGWTSLPAHCFYPVNGGGYTSVWGNTSSDVFSVLSVTTYPSVQTWIRHFDGQQWTSVYYRRCQSCSRGPRAVWSRSASDAFAVGDSGMVLRYDGTDWAPQSSGSTEALRAVWGDSAAVFAVGDGGTILYHDGSAWHAQSSGTTQPLFGVWGTSASDVFAVGGGGTILHYDGAVWNAQVSGTTQTLYGVWGSAPDGVFAGGDGGSVLHYDGTMWTAQHTDAPMDVRGIWGSSATSVFAVGEPWGGVIDCIEGYH